MMLQIDGPRIESEGENPDIKQPVHTPSRKRKRPDSVKDQREAEAAGRHASKQEALATAFRLFRTWLAEAPSVRHALAREAAPDERSGLLCASTICLSTATTREASSGKEGPPVDQQEATPSEDLDLLSLAELKAVLKPKFRFPGEKSEGDLFDRVHGNADDRERVATAHDVDILVPARSRFLVSDLSNFGKLHPGPGESGYDCIVIDPPWENRSARRAGKYPVLPSRRLLGLPIQQLLNKEGGLVVLWMTNRERLHRFVEAELLPAWGLELITIWHWLKVTAQGDLVVPLDIAHRHPYEAIILAAPMHWAANRNDVRKDLCIFACPGEHSRKPHLGRLLMPYLPDQPRCLELFARELAKGWTSAGNEAIKFQGLSRFTELWEDS